MAEPEPLDPLDPLDPESAGRRNISWPSIAFLTIAGTGSIAQLSASAEFGLGAVTLYLIPALLFLLPVALIAAELATGWRGGVFNWVKDGLGDRFGFQAQWLQWIQSVALYPSLLSFAAAALAFAIGNEALASNGAYTGAVILVVFWGATLVALRGVRATARISSAGMIFGTMIPAIILVVIMFIWLGDGQTSNTTLEVSAVIPPWAGISSIVLIISNFIAFAGLEVNAVHVRDMKDPGSGYPKALAVAGFTIVSMYMAGSIAIAVIVPNGSIDLNAGAAQAFTVFGVTFGIPWFGQILSGMLAIGILAAAISWVAGPSRGLLDVGREGYLPTRLQRTNKAGVSPSILVVQGIIVSFLSLAFALLPSVSSAFWVLQAMTAILYLTMYVIFFIAGWRLRKLRPDAPRKFKAPAIGLLATIGIIAASCAIAIALVPPTQFGNASPLLYAAMLIVGVAILGLSGQVVFQLRRPSWKQDRMSARPPTDE